MNRLLSVLAVSVVLVLYACSSTKPPSPAAERGNKIVQSIEDLSRTYGRKNLSAFMSLVSGKYRGRKAFERAVESVFSKYDTVRFTAQFARMFIMIENSGATRATFNWDSEWQAPDGTVLKNSGRATFVFDPKNAELVAVDGKNPFIPQTVKNRGK